MPLPAHRADEPIVRSPPDGAKEDGSSAGLTPQIEAPANEVPASTSLPLGSLQQQLPSPPVSALPLNDASAPPAAAQPQTSVETSAALGNSQVRRDTKPKVELPKGNPTAELAPAAVKLKLSDTLKREARLVQQVEKLQVEVVAAGKKLAAFTEAESASEKRQAEMKAKLDGALKREVTSEGALLHPRHILTLSLCALISILCYTLCATLITRPPHRPHPRPHTLTLALTRSPSSPALTLQPPPSPSPTPTPSPSLSHTLTLAPTPTSH